MYKVDSCAKCGSSNIEEEYTMTDRYKVQCSDCGRKVIADTRKRAREIWNEGLPKR